MKISNLKKEFGAFSLDIKALDLAPGRIYGLIGANGCGKSTLIKLLAGMISPDRGSIDYEGLFPRDITMLSRKPYLLHDTVYQNLLYPLKVRKIKPQREIVDEWMTRMGLADKRTQYAPNLSGGEQQKLALARALIFDPKLILLDEGLSNLDIESIAQVEALIRSRQQEAPVTWLVVNHQLSQIERLCDEVCFMDGGRILSLGNTRDLLFHPENEALARYLRFEAIIKEE